jgi:hypothetical protein
MRVLLVVLIMVCLFYYYRIVTIEKFDVSHTIPAQIWTYWNSDTITSPVVLDCIQTWRQHNPGYTINVLGPTRATQLLGFNPKELRMNDGPTRESDIVRSNILQRYGGVWIDATIYMTAPLIFKGQYEFYGYKIHKFTSKPGIPVVENWFFATVPQGRFITAWRDEFMKAERFQSIKDALNDLRMQGVMFDNIPIQEYLFMHICAQKVLQQDPSLLTSMSLQIAEETAFKYLVANDWNDVKGLESLCRGENIEPLIKFRGGERKYLEDHLDVFECIQRSLS